jgi:hypothetical protein
MSCIQVTGWERHVGSRVVAIWFRDDSVVMLHGDRIVWCRPPFGSEIMAISVESRSVGGGDAST